MRWTPVKGTFCKATIRLPHIAKLGYVDLLAMPDTELGELLPPNDSSLPLHEIIQPGHAVRADPHAAHDGNANSMAEIIAQLSATSTW